VKAERPEQNRKGEFEMKRNIKNHLLSALAALTLAAASGSFLVQAQSSYRVTIENRSDFDIYHVYLSAVRMTDWENDELGSQVLDSGYRFTLLDRFYPGRYDLKLVDEDGDSCVVPSVEISGNTTWNITNSWLLNCEFHHSR
jgi:hypothetical protein